MKALLWLLALCGSAAAQVCPTTHKYQLADVSVNPPAVIEQYDRCEGVVQGVLSGIGFVWFVQPDVPATTAVTFETPNACPKLSGIYAGIDWGVGQWSCFTFAWFGLAPNNVSFSQSVASRQFTFVDPHILLSLNVSSAAAGHLKLSSDAGEVLEMDVPKGGPLKITTGWSKPAKVITVDFTQKWLLSIGNLVFQ